MLPIDQIASVSSFVKILSFYLHDWNKKEEINTIVALWRRESAEDSFSLEHIIVKIFVDFWCVIIHHATIIQSRTGAKVMISTQNQFQRKGNFSNELWAAALRIFFIVAYWLDPSHTWNRGRRYRFDHNCKPMFEFDRIGGMTGNSLSLNRNAC